jgi:hypothetical protein
MLWKVKWSLSEWVSDQWVTDMVTTRDATASKNINEARLTHQQSNSPQSLTSVSIEIMVRIVEWLINLEFVI